MKILDTKGPRLFVPFKEVETWSMTAKKDYYENLRNICIKKKKHSTGSSKFVAFIAPLFRNFPIEIRGVSNLIEVNVCHLLMVRDKKGHGFVPRPFLYCFIL